MRHNNIPDPEGVEHLRRLRFTISEADVAIVGRNGIPSYNDAPVCRFDDAERSPRRYSPIQ